VALSGAWIASRNINITDYTTTMLVGIWSVMDLLRVALPGRAKAVLTFCRMNNYQLATYLSNLLARWLLCGSIALLV